MVFAETLLFLVVVVGIRNIGVVGVQTCDPASLAKAQVVPHSTTWLLPQVICGGVVSTTVTTWLQRLVFKQESYTSHERRSEERRVGKERRSRGAPYH